MSGLRKEPLFGHKERLYAQPDEGDDGPVVFVDRTKNVRVVPTPVERKVAVTQPEPTPDDDTPSTGRDRLSTALELAGIAALTTGGFLVASWLGCMILGVLLLVLGVATGYGG